MEAVSVSVAWSVDVGGISGPLFAPPVASPSYSVEDGRRRVVIAALNGDVYEVRPGGGGGLVSPGWPRNLGGERGGQFHVPPVFHDVNRDGAPDLILANSAGEVRWVDLGHPGRVMGSCEVPPYEVEREWYLKKEEGADEGRVRRRGRRRLVRGDDSISDEGQAPPYFDSYYDSLYDSPYGYYGYEDDLYSWFGDDGFVRVGDHDKVEVDPHILAAPAVADLTGDGRSELILAVTHFCDWMVHDKFRQNHQHPSGAADPSHYVIGRIMAYEFSSGDWLWTKELEVTTDYGDLRTYMYGSPTIADIDGDGRLDVIVGTAAGKLFILDAKEGHIRQGYPMEFKGQIHAQILAVDVVADPRLELVVADSSGTLTVLDSEGVVVWSRTLGDGVGILETPVVVDVNGDGELDIACTITGEDGVGRVWAVASATGKDLVHFPVSLPCDEACAISSGLAFVLGGYLAAFSLDGHIYFTAGKTGSVSKFYLGEHVYSPLLEVRGHPELRGDEVELVFATMGGEIIGLRVHDQGVNIATPSTTMGVGVSFGRGGSIFSFNVEGVGHTALPFVILDSREEKRRESSESPSEPRDYLVTVHLGSAQTRPIAAKTFTSPGEKSLSFLLTEPVKMTPLVIQMSNEYGLDFRDSSFLEYRVDDVLKWLVIGPCILFSIAVVLLRK